VDDLSDKNVKGKKTFRRGPFGTIIGLLHVLAGFFSFAWSMARLSIIGYKVIFDYGTAMGIFNYAYESTSLLLWASGIGILRGKLWGKIAASVWAVLVIAFHLSIYFIRKSYWGPFAPAPGWGDFFMAYYALACLGVVALGPLAAKLRLKLYALISGKVSALYAGSPAAGFMVSFRNNYLNFKSIIGKRK